MRAAQICAALLAVYQERKIAVSGIFHRFYIDNGFTMCYNLVTLKLE